jgi:addiction module RelE/StbE family toxin
MSWSVRISEPAQRDLEEIDAWYSARDPVAAEHLVGRIFQAAQGLAVFPEMGRAGRVEGTRELVVTDTPYLVAYRVRGEVVEIARVLHHARAWPSGL